LFLACLDFVIAFCVLVLMLFVSLDVMSIQKYVV